MRLLLMIAFACTSRVLMRTESRSADSRQAPPGRRDDSITMGIREGRHRTPQRDGAEMHVVVGEKSLHMPSTTVAATLHNSQPAYHGFENPVHALGRPVGAAHGSRGATATAQGGTGQQRRAMSPARPSNADARDVAALFGGMALSDIRILFFHGEDAARRAVLRKGERSARGAAFMSASG